MSAPSVLLIITQDTKEAEARFIRAELEKRGCGVVHLDASVRRTLGGAEIAPEAVARAAGSTIEAVRALGHEGKCLDVMSAGALTLAIDLFRQKGFAGVLGVGGSMGTTLATAIMRALPYGLPKMMVSTMASGFTQPFVGVKDIIMMNAVTDISGLNSINREVYRNAALGIAAMAHGYASALPASAPLVLIGTLGTTEACASRIRAALESDGCEVMIFHTSGTGGMTLDSIAAERDVAAVLDLSLIEISDLLHGGLFRTNPERSKAALARGIPTIFAPGNIDFIVAGPMDDAIARFPDRRYHVHNPALTAVRTTLAEMNAVADHVVALAEQATGSVHFFVPLQGFSHHDSPHGHMHDPSLPPLFAEHLRRAAPPAMSVNLIDSHFNDPAFADAIIAKVRSLPPIRKVA